MLRWIVLARSWHVLVRIGIATIAVAAATALQSPVGIQVPGKPFLLNFIVVVVSASVFGRTPGYFAAAESSIASLLYFEPVYSFRLAHAVDLLAIGAYAVMAALSVEAFCRLVDSALVEKSDANSARARHQESQARLAAVLTSTTDAIVGTTLDGTVTTWNEAAERMFGYAASEMIGQSIRRLMPADRQQEEALNLAHLARGERTEQYETARIAKDGRTVDVWVTILPIRDAQGRAIGASKIVHDITEHKRAEELLRRQADLLDQSHDAIFTWKIGGAITYWSRGAEALYGYTKEEAIGQISHKLLQTRSPIPMQEVEAQIVREGAWYGELTHTTRDGRTIVVESRLVRVSYNGEPYTLETNRDITEHKRAEELLRRQADLLDQSHDAIFTWKIGGAITYWSRGAEALYGYTKEEAIGQISHELLRTRHPIPVQEVEAQVVREGAWYGELTHTTRDGRTVIVESRHVRVSYNGEPYTLETNRDITARERVTYALETNRDITARKQAEARLAEREAQLALFIEHAPAAIAMFDDKMRYLAVSRRFLSDYKLPADAEIIGHSHYQIVPDTPQRWRKLYARVLAGEELGHEEDPFPRQDGRVERVQWSMKPWRTADGRIGGALLFSQFVTGILADREARFQATFENAAVGIAHVAPDGRWLRVNQALSRILGYPVDELITKTFQDVTHPDDLAADLAQGELMRKGTIDSYDSENRYLRMDGAIIWGKKTVSSVRKSNGSIDYFVSVIEDISARKQAEDELRRSEERFRSSLLQSPLPMLLFDNREQILAISQSWLKETGYSSPELRQVKDWTTRAYGERSDEMLEQIRQIISTQPEAHTAEMKVRTRDGRNRLWSFVDSALGVQSDGRHLFISLAQDITEQRAHEEQVQLLMREVSHRAKNMLSLVHAIARQTAARGPEDFIERFTARIQALAANQDLLIRSEWQGVDVEDLVRAQLAHFADLIGFQIAVDGPKLRLNAAASQAIGLALHELSTNAGKYGALSVAAGRVDVSWRLDGDIFTMSWTERNGPPVREPERRGFGSAVIDPMAKRSVGGEVQLDFAPSGLVWRLTCPATNALERERNLQNNTELDRFQSYDHENYKMAVQ
jgi:PAS domain S-box-containing protein